MYPKIQIKINNIVDNVKNAKLLCEQNNISLSLVTKVLSDNKQVVEELIKHGVDRICESRAENFISYKDLDVEKWLIRIPMECEISDVVKYTDVSLNSELDTIVKIDEEAKKQGKIHKVILMYELGDLREGCLEPELEKVVGEVLKLNNVELYGIGTNLSCYGGVLPYDENMSELANVVKKLEQKFDYKFKIVSGGNSTSYKMLQEGVLPKEINNLRFGEVVFFGNVPCYDEKPKNLHQNNFVLKAQIIELKDKPSVPWGKRCKCNSCGEPLDVAIFEDRGIRKRAIIALGKQDVRTECLTPVDDKISILEGSSDHIILDVTDSKTAYKVGDVVDFNLSYSGVLSAMTSKYIKREII